MTSEDYEEDQRALLLEARTAIRRVEYILEQLSNLMHYYPMTKRVIDLEIEKNKRLTDLIQGTVERQYKKSA
jgi:hypothetical protein